MSKMKTPILLAIVGLLTLSSCMTTKLVIDPSLPQEPKLALLTGLNVGMENTDSDGDLLSAAVNIAQNMDLDDFGVITKDGIINFLGENGFEVFLDAQQAKIGDSPFNTGESLSALGYWVHPETSAITANHFLGWAIGFNAKEHIAGVKGDTDTNYFVFTDVKIYKNQGFILVHPLLVIRLAVVDSAGEVVFEAQALGEGESSFLFADTSKENLELALNNAIQSLYEL